MPIPLPPFPAARIPPFGSALLPQLPDPRADAHQQRAHALQLGLERAVARDEVLLDAGGGLVVGRGGGGGGGCGGGCEGGEEGLHAPETADAGRGGGLAGREGVQGRGEVGVAGGCGGVGVGRLPLCGEGGDGLGGGWMVSLERGERGGW
ncbi:hypothetical protein BT67DRAFT_132363, partial [Trichocladium antarcticum]